MLTQFQKALDVETQWFQNTKSCIMHANPPMQYAAFFKELIRQIISFKNQTFKNPDREYKDNSQLHSSVTTLFYLLHYSCMTAAVLHEFIVTDTFHCTFIAPFLIIPVTGDLCLIIHHGSWIYARQLGLLGHPDMKHRSQYCSTGPTSTHSTKPNSHKV